MAADSKQTAMRVKRNAEKDEELSYEIQEPEEVYSNSSNTHSYVTMYPHRLPRRRKIPEPQPQIPLKTIPIYEDIPMLPEPLQMKAMDLDTLRRLNKSLESAPRQEKLQMRIDEVVKEEKFLKTALSAMDEYFKKPNDTAFRMTVSVEKQRMSVEMASVEEMRKTLGGMSHAKNKRYFEEQAGNKTRSCV